MTFTAKSGYALKKITLTWREGNNYTPTLSNLSATNATMPDINTINCNSGATEVVLSNSASNNNSQVSQVTIIYTDGAPPVAVTGVSLDKTELSLEAGQTEKLIATVAPSDATNKKVTWKSSNTSFASVDNEGVVTAQSIGEADITVTTEDGSFTATCHVTVTAATPVPVTGISLQDRIIGLGTQEALVVTYTPTNANTGKACTWESSAPTIVSVNNGVVSGLAVGEATITATTIDNTSIKASCTVKVEEKTIPPTTLSLHEPDIYEEKTIAGGYGAKLTINGGREYEVYYMTRDADSKFCISTTSADQTAGITTRSSDYECTANDGWFKFKGTGWSGEEKSLGDEFSTTIRRLDLDNSCEFSMHIKGFDQFAIIAKDKKIDTSTGQTKPDDNRYLEVYIDDILQAQQFNTDPTIRRYDMSTSEHVVRIKHKGSEKSSIYAFSLRVANQPRTKWIKGNDSTQNVLQTTEVKPVYYFTKYNSMGETKLEWNGLEATGVTLSIKASTDIGDTLALGGFANCPTGEYNYNVVTYMGGLETSRVSGKLKVSSDIKALSDTLVDAYQGEEMEVIEFHYYALNASAVNLTWKNNNAPTGISGNGAANNRYVISGTTSAAPGKYYYTITVTGSTTVITGYIDVISQDLGENPVLYLYQTKSPQRGYEKDNIYTYLKSKNINLQPRTAINKLRSEAQYSKFKWILISEDVNADNSEVLAIAEGGAKLPVLNMKGFTYTEDRLGWGEPDNGSIDTLTHNGQYIFVQRPEHPIFKSFNAQAGSKIKVFDALEQNGVMPINIDYPNSYCLATAYTRDIEDYYKDGELQTAIHEIPASERGGKKYICFPLSITSSKKLSSEGKTLLNAIVDYLLSAEAASITAPKLQINSFKIGEVAGTIDQASNRIDVIIDKAKYPDYDLKALKPVVTVEDPLTHVTPTSGETIDFSVSTFMPVDYIVTDYINRRVYEVAVSEINAQSIDEVYSIGEWVNIFDVFGRKVATTNENIYSMELPHGMYIAVTENGNTIKLTK